ncbi:putative hydrolase [Gordonia hirsuta DSM 44140 = NBRC 16056]|uniref:Putative hydrolase n=1 Tax=Gordonia hirsuta DSM 44140 = NBRC 16056 TaxID=1121927 RepID=L7LBG9_9ACTN|nr:alpha/beta hydrolase [Gordonia hirsuta]GAC57388.1 putative hydrolase [Gordonia hirsuta DSM 44140 = NBRC 16056]
MPVPSSRSRLLAVLTAVALVATGCTVGPDPGPGMVHGRGGADTDDRAARLPALTAPKNDLNYRACGPELAEFYQVDAPKDLQVDCAGFIVPIDPDDDRSTDLRMTAVRITNDATPADAAPLVLTTGTDLPSSRLAIGLNNSSLAPLLDKHPIVAVDRRGIGRSAPLDCLTRAQRETLSNDGASGARNVAERSTALSTSARSGADICNETLDPDQLRFANADAAADLEFLRDYWEVDHLGLIGVGAGSSVALAYLGAHPDRVGRLILDSPVGFNEQATAAAAARADGVQNSLATFAERCAALGCSLGPGGVPMLNRVIHAGATGSLPGLSDTTILAAVTTQLALGPTDPDGLKRLADAISAADRGDGAALRRLAGAAVDLRDSDGQLVARCNDLVGRPSLAEVPKLAEKWAADAPMTANTAALSLARCDGWGVADIAAATSSFPIDPLVLIGQNDPINGSKAAEALSPLLITTGAESTHVNWDGLGYSVLSRSDCAAALTAEYLGTDGLSGSAERACPA